MDKDGETVGDKYNTISEVTRIKIRENDTKDKMAPECVFMDTSERNLGKESRERSDHMNQESRTEKGRKIMYCMLLSGGMWLVQ